jgi:hypothetical protein
MVRRVLALATSVVGLALAAVLVVGLAAPASASATGKHKRPGHIPAPLILEVEYNGVLAGTHSSVHLL